MLSNLQSVPETQPIEIVRDSLEKPLAMIAKNAGVDDGWAVKEVEKSTGNIGLNALNGKFEDLVVAGVIDPVKVTRSAVQNAASIAMMILTTEALVTNFDKDDKDKQRIEGSVR